MILPRFWCPEEQSRCYWLAILLVALGSWFGYLHRAWAYFPCFAEIPVFQTGSSPLASK